MYSLNSLGGVFFFPFFYGPLTLVEIFFGYKQSLHIFDTWDNHPIMMYWPLLGGMPMWSPCGLVLSPIGTHTHTMYELAHGYLFCQKKLTLFVQFA